MPPSPQSRCFVRSCIARRCLYSAHAMGSVARADKAEVAEDGGAAADALAGDVVDGRT